MSCTFKIDITVISQIILSIWHRSSTSSDWNWDDCTHTLSTAHTTQDGWHWRVCWAYHMYHKKSHLQIHQVNTKGCHVQCFPAVSSLQAMWLISPSVFTESVFINILPATRRHVCMLKCIKTRFHHPLSNEGWTTSPEYTVFGGKDYFICDFTLI